MLRLCMIDSPAASGSSVEYFGLVAMMLLGATPSSPERVESGLVRELQNAWEALDADQGSFHWHRESRAPSS